MRNVQKTPQGPRSDLVLPSVPSDLNTGGEHWVCRFTDMHLDRFKYVHNWDRTKSKLHVWDLPNLPEDQILKNFLQSFFKLNNSQNVGDVLRELGDSLHWPH